MKKRLVGVNDRKRETSLRSFSFAPTSMATAVFSHLGRRKF